MTLRPRPFGGFALDSYPVDIAAEKRDGLSIELLPAGDYRSLGEEKPRKSVVVTSVICKRGENFSLG